MVAIPDSPSNHSRRFRLGAKKGHNLTHSADGRASEGSQRGQHSEDNIQSSVSTWILNLPLFYLY
jgi:hypothetical protein